MCCRIFNSTNADFPVTGRNMNWKWNFDTSLYSSPKHIEKQGLSDDYCCIQKISPESVFTWRAKYSSVSSIMSGEHVDTRTDIGPEKQYRGFEYACADGMNDQGLMVNALADSDSFYGKPVEGKKLLSTLRWAQYILDSFATVAEAAEAMKNPDYSLVDQGMPDASEHSGQFHICLSDPTGDTAIVEYRDGTPAVYHDPRFRVVTNNPNYSTQLILDEYWLYQWDATEVKNKHPLRTAPGGHSSPQMFEQASYNLSFSTPQQTSQLATAQTRSLMGQVAVHLGYNANKFEPPLIQDPMHTIWTNLGDHINLRYHYINSIVGNDCYLSVSNSSDKTYKVKVMN